MPSAWDSKTASRRGPRPAEGSRADSRSARPSAPGRTPRPSPRSRGPQVRARARRPKAARRRSTSRASIVRADRLNGRVPLVRAVQDEQPRRADLDLVQVPQTDRGFVAQLAAVDERSVQAPQLLDRADGTLDAEEPVSLADLL